MVGAEIVRPSFGAFRSHSMLWSDFECCEGNPRLEPSLSASSPVVWIHIQDVGFEAA